MASKGYEYRDKLMRGGVKVETKPSSNIVRVFVSSTFADMSDERNVLYNNAYPELRNFCQNLGLEFQVIDMRWGVRDTAAVDHTTTALCLLEVKTCRKVSLGPYFVIFFGNRYGYQPLPTSIPETEYQVLKEVVKEGGSDEAGLLDAWYKLDENSIPPARILEPITKHFPHFDDVEPEFAKKRDEAREQWGEIFQQLSTILRDSAEVGVKLGLLSSDLKLRFCKSITHMEIEEAMQEETASAFLAYNREISDLHKHTNEEKARRFIDLLEGEEKIDKLRQKMLKTLKKTVRIHTEGRKTFKRYEVLWKNLDSLQKEESSEGSYLSAFCGDFVADMKKNIAACLEQKVRESKIESAEDALLEEVVHHARFEVLKTADFCGREQLIGDITNLINDDENNQPIVLAGTSGCGKTALMAKLVETQRNQSPHSVFVYRFLGTSPDSSNIHKLLTSLILQISTVFGEKIPAQHLLQNFTEVVEHFTKLLKNVSKKLQQNVEEYLMIFLDSIDQLSVEDGAHRMTWLPKRMPERVKLVMSSLPEPDFDIVPTMRRYLPESNFRIIQGLNVETAREILQKCLRNEGRQLTESQTEKILKAFENSPYPLFLKLMLEEAKRWKSHDNTDGLILPETSRAAISRYYERLETEHGKTFVSKAIGFIVAARDGVTENELQDILSLDDGVLHDVYEHWSPPTKDTVRIPSFTWTRLNYDLAKYLVQRQATGHTVLALYHRQFIEVARERYLQSSASVSVYDVLSEYFLGMFAEGRTKKLKLKMWNEAKEVDRKVAKQPLRFSSDVFNVRKFREMPYCLLKANSLEELKWKVLANAEWMHAKINAFSIKEVIEDYNLVLNEVPEIEVKLIRDALKLAKPTLEFPSVRNHLFTELYCRLKFFVERYPKYIGGLVARCGELIEQLPDELLLPLTGYFQPPGGPLRTTITGFKTPVTALTFLHPEKIFAAGSQGGNVMVWDTENDEIIHKIEAHDDTVLSIAFTGSAVGGKIASCSKDGSVKMFHLDNGNQCFSESIEELDTNSFTKLLTTSRHIICVTDSKMKAWDIVEKWIVFKRNFEGSVKSAALDTSANIIIIGMEDGMCLSFNAKSGEEGAKVQMQIGSIVDIFPLKECCLVAGKEGKIISINPESLEIYDTTQSDDGELVDSALSRFGPDVAIAFKHCLKVYSVEGRNIKLKSSLEDSNEVVRKLQFVNQYTLAVAYENKKVLLWDIKNPENLTKIGSWEGTGAPIDHLAIGENVGVTASKKVFYLKVWDLDDRDSVPLEPTLPLYPSTSTLSSNGQLLAYLQSGKIVIQVVNAIVKNPDSKNKHLAEVECDSNSVNSLKFAQNGESLLVLKQNGQVEMISGHHTGEGVVDISTVKSEPWQNEESCFMCVGDKGKVALVLNQASDRKYILRCLETEHLSISYTIEFAFGEIDGEITSMLAVGQNASTIILGTSSGLLYVVRKTENGHTKRLASGKHGNEITCLVVNRAGTGVFSGSTGRTRRLWDLKNDNLVLKHELHFDSLLQSGVTSAQFTSDDKFLITGSRERVITIWDTQTGVLVGSQYVYAPVLDVAISDTNKLVYTSELGYVAVARFRPPTKRPNVKLGKNQSKSSTTCRIM